VASDNVRLAKVLGAVIGGRDIVALLADPGAQDAAWAALEPFVKPDFEVAMIGPDYMPRTGAGHGFDGFSEAWLDWTSPFETFQIDVNEMVDAGDRVVSIARQTGRTKTGGVEVETQAAAVVTIDGGRISRIEFHLDRAAALRAAGLEPG
jgi:ketosteroid isomerase-like protein